ncbi:MAG: adenylate/guanylate cyclase domain-containing protein [Bacteroidota bacterium]
MNHKILVLDRSREIINSIDELNGKLKKPVELIPVNKEEIYDRSLELSPDYILVDASMLNQNGSISLRSLKQDPKTLNIPVILITDNLPTEKLKDYFDIGISDFLFKPVNIDELSVRLKSINQRNKYINKLHRENELLNSLSLVAKSTANAVVIIFPNGEVEWVNEGFENMYGCSISEYLKNKTHAIFSSESKKFQKAVEKFEEDNNSISFEHDIITVDDEKKWIQTTLTPIYNEQNQLVKIVAVESDITALYKEKKKSDELLQNILPFEVAEQLKKKGQAKSRKYRTVTVLFADFENFSGLTRIYSTKELIRELNVYVKKFDEIIDKHYIEKIKTIGDAYMCAGGLPLKNKSNPIDVTLAGLEIQKYINDIAIEKQEKGETPWELRLGIHTGEVMAGVIGNKKFAYDIWGNAVNTASRMEGTGEVGKVNISGTTYEFIKDYFDCTYRGKIKVKNISEEIDMFFVNRLKEEYSEDEEGITPNAEFRKILAKY